MRLWWYQVGQIPGLQALYVIAFLVIAGELAIIVWHFSHQAWCS